MTRSLVGVCVLAAITASAGCDRAEVTGPPDIRLGRIECDECGMLISEDRFSSALLIDRDGAREYVLFDDLGCMLDFEFDDGGKSKVIEGFAHDYSTREWISVTKAAFLFAGTDTLETPMGSGIAAFADRAGAERARGELGGEIMEYAALASARRAWMDARHDTPDPDR